MWPWRGMQAALATLGLTKQALYQEATGTVAPYRAAVNVRGRNLAEFLQNAEQQYADTPGVLKQLRAQGRVIASQAPDVMGTVGPRGAVSGGAPVRQGLFARSDWDEAMRYDRHWPRIKEPVPVTEWKPLSSAFHLKSRAISLGTLATPTAAHEAGHAAQAVENPHTRLMDQLDREVDATRRARVHLGGARIPAVSGAAAGTYAQADYAAGLGTRMEDAVEQASRRVFPQEWRRVDALQVARERMPSPDVATAPIITKLKLANREQIDALYKQIFALEDRLYAPGIPGKLTSLPPAEVEALRAQRTAWHQEIERLKDFDEKLYPFSPEVQAEVARLRPAPEVYQARRKAWGEGGVLERVSQRIRELRNQLLNPVQYPQVLDAMYPEERATVQALRQQVGKDLNRGFGEGTARATDRWVDRLIRLHRQNPVPPGVAMTPEAGLAAPKFFSRLRRFAR